MQAVQPMQAVSSWSMPKRTPSMVWLWARVVARERVLARAAPVIMMRAPALIPAMK